MRPGLRTAGEGKQRQVGEGQQNYGVFLFPVDVYFSVALGGPVGSSSRTA